MNRSDLLPLLVSLGFATGLMGWMVWSQQPGELAGATQVAPAVAATQTPVAPLVDEGRVAELRITADQSPENAQARVDLGYLYFEVQRFDEAIPWFEAALAINPLDVSVSTDLGVAYFYTDAIDRALDQFAHSLEVDPGHAQTLLDLGIVRALGKQDLEGAIQAWEEVRRLDPDSPEAVAAADAIERIRAAHP